MKARNPCLGVVPTKLYDPPKVAATPPVPRDRKASSTSSARRPWSPRVERAGPFMTIMASSSAARRVGQVGSGAVIAATAHVLLAPTFSTRSASKSRVASSAGNNRGASRSIVTGDPTTTTKWITYGRPPTGLWPRCQAAL